MELYSDGEDAGYTDEQLDKIYPTWIKGAQATACLGVASAPPPTQRPRAHGAMPAPRKLRLLSARRTARATRDLARLSNSDALCARAVRRALQMVGLVTVFLAFKGKWIPALVCAVVTAIFAVCPFALWESESCGDEAKFPDSCYRSWSYGFQVTAWLGFMFSAVIFLIGNKDD